MLVAAHKLMVTEGAVVVLAGTGDHGEELTFAVDRREAGPILEELAAGREPVCQVAPWQVLSSTGA